MEKLPCAVTFRVYEPLEEYRSLCPFVLLTSEGVHPHPIPLPTHTPMHIRRTIHTLLESAIDDMADMTPRRFLGHPIVRQFLAKRFPGVPHPTLSLLHASLANRDHLGAMIKYAKNIYYPFGTGWNAVRHLMRLQTLNLSYGEQYIRRMFTVDAKTLRRHDEDEGVLCSDDALCIVVCMFGAASHRLHESGRFVQSDISFKRVNNYYEFELGCMDRKANTSLIFCRVFTNSQCAEAHKLIFDSISSVVKEDTGVEPRFRHLHGKHPGDYDDMILQWGADQHRGQAKGLGLYLQARAAKLPPRADFHEPHRTIQSLGVYEHLHRIYRLCSNHFLRNIKHCAVPSKVKARMRSLWCIYHPDFEGTLQLIREEGGKAGRDWVKDKDTSGFAWSGICHAKSKIPLLIWQAGDSSTNLIETVHRDVNREGVHCTLLGGIQKGLAFDVFKQHTLDTQEDYGVFPTYSRGYISVNAYRNLRRKVGSQQRAMLAGDDQTRRLNEKIVKSHQSLRKAQQALHVRIERSAANVSQELDRLVETRNKMLAAYRETVQDAKETVTAIRGTGDVELHIFPEALGIWTDQSQEAHRLDLLATLATQVLS
ncbi:hypothetical protein C8F01DRAFT_1031905 [Mycena amicta]|nr:hypothetical protein C8F01DRAFT_1031905 [Mycena amicta]